MPARPGEPWPPLRRIRWPKSYRIIASRYPPVALFEDIAADPAALDALIALEQLTNPRIRDEVGDIALVPPEDRVIGPGATWVMAAFTHLNPAGNRFSDGSFGVYYAGNALAVAIHETAFHFARIATDSGDGARREDMRVLLGKVDCDLHDVTALPVVRRRAVMNADDYRASQALGRSLSDAGAPGVHYDSVRSPGGVCVGIFRARLAPPPVQERHLRFDYDGSRVRRYFDYKTKAWVVLNEVKHGGRDRD